MRPHSWSQSFFEPVGVIFGMTTCVQNYSCRNCGATERLPALGSSPKEFGCTGVVKKKIVRPNPFEGRDDDRDEEKRSKHYQQAEKGKKQKKNQRQPVQW